MLFFVVFDAVGNFRDLFTVFDTRWLARTEERQSSVNCFLSREFACRPGETGHTIATTHIRHQGWKPTLLATVVH